MHVSWHLTGDKSELDRTRKTVLRIRNERVVPYLEVTKKRLNGVTEKEPFQLCSSVSEKHIKVKGYKYGHYGSKEMKITSSNLY